MALFLSREYPVYQVLELDKYEDGINPNIKPASCKNALLRSILLVCINKDDHLWGATFLFNIQVAGRV